MVLRCALIVLLACQSAAMTGAQTSVADDPRESILSGDIQPSDSGSLADGRSDPQMRVFTAESIDLILEQHPELVSDVKEQIAQRLQKQGTRVTAQDITDQALEQQVAASQQLRAGLTRYLSARGFRPPESNDSTESALSENRGAGPPERTSPLERTTQCVMGEPCIAPTVSVKEKEADIVQKRPPYQTQALKDLYTQVVQSAAPLRRFGSEFFLPTFGTRAMLRGATPGDAPLDMPVGPDYVIGAGDSLEIGMWGASTQAVTRVVDREGRVMLPEAGALQIAGLTMAHAEDSVRAALKQQFRNTEVSITVARMHTVRVYVAGDVQRPGGYDVSALATPLSALYAAGGPTATGSLRVVRHMRGKVDLEDVDLYDFFVHGVHAASVRLESGDTLLVPPAGPQVELAGAVRRAAIYEMVRDGESLAEIANDAGGFIVSASVKNIVVERIISHHGRETLAVGAANDSSALTKFTLQDGDRVFVGTVPPYSERVVYTEGHLMRPGRKAFHEGMRFSDVVTGYADLLPEPADRAEIVRLVPPDLHAETIQVDLREALAGNMNLSLQPFDTIRVFGRYEEDAPEVTVSGEVLRPGTYPLSEGMTAGQLVRMAGGFKRDALMDRADVASYSVVDGREVVGTLQSVRIGDAVAGRASDLALHAGDILTIHQITGWTDIGQAVTVDGQVKYPGSYGFVDGETLSSVLRRAGGFRASAYPEGAVLIREQVRELEAKSRDELVRQIEATSAAARLSPNLAGGDSAQMLQLIKAQQEEVLTELKNHPPAGRLVVHLSSEIDAWANTDADIELRRGDVVTVPKRPGFVLVTGQVYNATAITFRANKTAGWYLARAGGANSTANRKEIFVIRANGSIVGRGSGGWFQGDVLSTKLSPGDVVVVPQKIIGRSLVWRNLLTTAQIASSLAITAVVAGL